MRLAWIFGVLLTVFTYLASAASTLPTWKLSFGPCLVGSGDLIGGSIGAGLQWNRRYWAVGFESRFQSVTWMDNAGYRFKISSPDRVYDQHNGFQQDFEIQGRLPLGPISLAGGFGPSLVYFDQLTQDWVSGNTIPRFYFRHAYGSFGNYGLGYHYQTGVDYNFARTSTGFFMKMSNYGGTQTVFSVNFKLARSFGWDL